MSGSSSMTTFEDLPREIILEIGEMCVWPASPEEPHSSRHLAALTRTSRWLYNMFNAILYRYNLTQEVPLDSCVLWAAEKGLKLNVINNNGFTPLHIAADRGDADLVGVLLAQIGIRVRVRTTRGGNALSLAVAKGHLNCARLILERPELDPADRGRSGATALHVLCKKTRDQSLNTLDFICCLIDRGCPVDAKKDDGRTALQIALLRGLTDIASLLLYYSFVQDTKMDTTMDTNMDS
ncbi:unnamed protein product [Clonostachys rosea]|uniref:F-box domain-containing protein n=1 Tax=Bionectria ochroleuca TaxID=29856 RepID=A0ABY6TUR9_BIOOC|nr:unnamed protein product [Clonostachys rosea]